jgi:GTPase involved in cell partitioning and DNA repair
MIRRVKMSRSKNVISSEYVKMLEIKVDQYEKRLENLERVVYAPKNDVSENSQLSHLINILEKNHTQQEKEHEKNNSYKNNENVENIQNSNIKRNKNSKNGNNNDKYDSDDDPSPLNLGRLRTVV